MEREDCCRRNSVTEFNLRGQLPVYNKSFDDDDSSMIDVTPVTELRRLLLMDENEAFKSSSGDAGQGLKSNL